jgi:hypothetical protein
MLRRLIRVSLVLSTRSVCCLVTVDLDTVVRHSRSSKTAHLTIQKFRKPLHTNHRPSRPSYPLSSISKLHIWITWHRELSQDNFAPLSNRRVARLIKPQSFLHVHINTEYPRLHAALILSPGEAQSSTAYYSPIKNRQLHSRDNRTPKKQAISHTSAQLRSL